MKAQELINKARHEEDYPMHPDYGKVKYTFTGKELKDLFFQITIEENEEGSCKLIINT